MAALVALLAVVWVTAGSALAQPEVSLTPGSDGRLLLVGGGWRPGQRLVVSVGRDVFPVFVDSAGDFEVATGLNGPNTLPLRVSRLDPMPLGVSITDVRGPVAAESAPSPMAVEFARSMLGATAWVGVLFAGLVAITVVHRVRYR